MDQGDWNEVSLFELEFLNWKKENWWLKILHFLQDHCVRSCQESEFLTIQISKNKKYLKTVRVLSLGVFQQCLKSSRPEILLSGSMLRWQDWESFQVFINLKMSSFLLFYVWCEVLWDFVNSVFALFLPSLILGNQHFYPLPNPFFFLDWALVVVWRSLRVSSSFH